MRSKFIKNSRTLELQNSFTLVELMIAVVILSFGLGVIIRSYASALSAFSASQNYFFASRLAWEKLSELEISAWGQDGVTVVSESGSFRISSREFSWVVGAQEITEPDYLSEDLVLAGARINWREREASKDFNLAMYLPKKKEK